MRISSLRNGTDRLLLLLILIVMTGCSDSGPKRYRLTGTVQFDGKPVPAGMIYFDPDATKERKGPQGFAPIVDGKFDTNQGKGHIGGPMKVRIVGLASVPGATNDDTPKPGLFPDFIELVDLDAAGGSRGFLISRENSESTTPQGQAR